MGAHQVVLAAEPLGTRHALCVCVLCARDLCCVLFLTADLVSGLFLCFFFSSRRRHTRFDCDWSSDVCSSDLCTQSIAYLPPPLRRRFVSMRGPLLSLVTLASVAAAAGMTAQTPHLGAIDFPTSGAPAAQPSFIRGVLLLHSFEYRDAAQAFREAQRIDPRFALAYWGEALTYTHPVWDEQG